MLHMARLLDPDEEDDREGHSRKLYIDALLQHRRPSLIEDRKLLQRIESKTAQHRSPFSANISRKHASILSALSPPGKAAPKRGHKRSLTPSREASQRQAFEVFEWDRDMDPVAHEEGRPQREEDAVEDWSTPPEPRPVLTKYLASLNEEGEDLEVEEAEPEPYTELEPEPEPEYVPEAEDLVDDSILEEAKALVAAVPEPEGTDATEEEEAPEVVPEPEPEPAPEEDVVVEGRPGHPPREGGEFPVYLMEPLDEAEVEGAAGLDMPRRGEVNDLTVLTFDRETDMTDDEEATPGETETDDSLVGLSPAHRWPSDTGLELHIDGFEHIAATSDLCPRCGRRVTARNRLLTCNDCGTVACETCEIKTQVEVDTPYYYDWHFELPLCVNCYEKAFNIQKMLAKAKAALGMGNHTYAFYHAQQALRTDPASPYAEEAQRIISQVDQRRRESAEQDEAWKRQRSKMSRTSVVRED
ncbi:MAG: hypothetical protein KAS77_01600 [Thermoplasmata archaeon]|nr:hypothetical protein [Thermoplasmata archaeon]